MVELHWRGNFQYLICTKLIAVANIKINRKQFENSKHSNFECPFEMTAVKAVSWRRKMASGYRRSPAHNRDRRKKNKNVISDFEIAS